jgi:hypothetical protein
VVQQSNPLPQLCRSSEPFDLPTRLHDWSLGCVSSHCLASLPHVGVLLISARKATSVACYSLSCAHEPEAYRDETKKRCSGPDRKDQSLPFLAPFWTIACSKIGLPCLPSQLSWAAAQMI